MSNRLIDLGRQRLPVWQVRYRVMLGLIENARLALADSVGN